MARTHYANPGAESTLCLRSISGAQVTQDPDQVDCRSCRKDIDIAQRLNNPATIRAATSVYEQAREQINRIPTTDAERREVAQEVIRQMTMEIDRDFPA